MPSRKETLELYHPDRLAVEEGRSAIEQYTVLSLLRTHVASSPGSRLPPLLDLIGEWEPADEIMNGFEQFVREWDNLFVVVVRMMLLKLIRMRGMD
jgi:hypothetical protein